MCHKLAKVNKTLKQLKKNVNKFARTLDHVRHHAICWEWGKEENRWWAERMKQKKPLWKIEYNSICNYSLFFCKLEVWMAITQLDINSIIFNSFAFSSYLFVYRTPFEKHFIYTYFFILASRLESFFFCHKFSRFWIILKLMQIAFSYFYI